MRQFAEEDILRSLQEENPWWRDPEKARPPKEWKERDLLAPLKERAFAKNPGRAIVLMGQRRIGKSVLLAQLVHEAVVGKKYPPKRVALISLDAPLYDGLALDELTRLAAKAAGTAGRAKSLLVFDEAHYLKGWQSQLKALAERRPDIQYAASGAVRAAPERDGREPGPSPFTELILPPVSFHEFTRFRRKNNLVRRARAHASKANMEKVNRLFREYLNCGGYPEAVKPEARANPGRFIKRGIIGQALRNDLPALHGIRNAPELHRLLAQIARHSGREFSPLSLAQNVGLAPGTVSRYLKYLEDAFLIVRLRRVNDEGANPQREPNFKLYLTNPSLRAALFSPAGAGDRAHESLVKTALLGQIAFHPGLEAPLRYARWNEGRRPYEVDLAQPSRDRERAAAPFAWACEITWSDNPDLRSLRRFGARNPDTPLVAATKTLDAKRAYSLFSEARPVRLIPSALLCHKMGAGAESPASAFAKT